ncbi:MAG: hypothetical protein JWN25_395 [Verrucomicrobiales bacterium]|nr:hypothetical protein [Verrucomicrobiales bacterium]MDB6131510.1 hypothetical protein [Verrucomicrobiales bacterium]
MIRHSLLRLSFLLLLLLSAPLVRGNALDEYVKAPDEKYSWKILSTFKTNSLEITSLELTSQGWHDTTWKHILLIVKPEKITNPEKAFLFITGDGNGLGYVPMLAQIAQSGGTIAAVLNSVPNQPLLNNLKEDALIAYTFEQYMKTGDKTWPVLFPMVKSAVKAMDCLQEFAAKEQNLKIEKFVVAGASKRGWTTWLTAAVDKRVIAIAPMVIDMLNMKVQTEWSQKAYGKQSDQIRDYTERGLIGQMDHPRMVELRSFVDPYSYRDQYTLPKLLLLGTNDPYWTVDSLRHYWSDLPGSKVVFQTPNAGHDLGDKKQAIQTLSAWYEMICLNESIPEVSWVFATKDGKPTVQIKSSQPYQKISLWTANSSDRDFRNDHWTAIEQQPSGKLQQEIFIPSPSDNYEAYLVEIELRTPKGQVYKLSTEARVTPDDLK